MSADFKVFSATELWQRDTRFPSIPTFSQNLDKALGSDGVQLGSFTELLGLPGSGKTQLCLQLCASVQIPKELGGLDSAALYIDTNTNFTATRFKEILTATLTRCQRILGYPLQTTEEEAFSKLFYVNAFGLEKFCAFMYTLPHSINDYSDVRLIVIDSIAFPFKEGITTKQRTGVLFRIMAHLQKLAVDQHIAVVVSNEMTTRVGLSSGAVVGSLGDAWSHHCNKRLLLSAPDSSETRLALILKSNNSPEAVGRFRITRDGIRDLE